MATELLQALDRDWEVLASSRAAAATLREWHTDPALWGFPDLVGLIAHVHRRGKEAEGDRVLAALARRAPTDDLAARVLLQAMLPGVKSLVRTYRWAGPEAEIASMVVAAAFERIRTYPFDRRPSRIAANLFNDTKQTVHRKLSREAQASAAFGPVVELNERMAHQPARHAATELIGLIDEAVRTGKLSRESARMILLTRVADQPITTLPGAEGQDPQTLRRRRLRAEAQLAAAVA